jgi:hypothetical protein
MIRMVANRPGRLLEGVSNSATAAVDVSFPRRRYEINGLFQFCGALDPFPTTFRHVSGITHM